MRARSACGKLVDQAHGYCFIANSLNSAMRIEPTVERTVASRAMPAPDLLQKLLTAPGPPGHEGIPARVWREAAEGFADEVTTDRLGTTVARVNGAGDHPLMAVVGHIDEIARAGEPRERQGLPARRAVGRLGRAGAGGPARGDPHPRRRGAGRGGAKAAAPDRRRGAQEGRGAEEPARGHRREGRRRGALDGLAGRPGRDRGRAARAAERPRGLARARQPARGVRGDRGGAAREGGRRQRRARSAAWPPCRRRSARTARA